MGLFAADAHAGTGLALSSLPLAFGRDWWLPPNYSVHGKEMDLIFLVIFWITTVIFVAVQGVLVYLLIKYRGRPDRKKGIFSHGNTRLEMIWTIIPAIILIVIALWTKRVWDNYRYNPISDDPNLVKILVIGQQFKWNVVYSGPDGELGRYLIYPKTTDLKWPTVPEGKDFPFPAVPGPAYLPEEQARQVLNTYIETINPLGKDFDDPKGKDDDWRDALARPVEIPKGRPVEINIGSRDVIHDFFLPNFRVKLDAVPGMRGKLYLTATKSCRELQDPPRAYKLEELRTLVRQSSKQSKEVNVVINKDTPGAQLKKPRRGPGFYAYLDKDGNTLLRDGAAIGEPDIDALRAAGITEVTVVIPYYWELVCEELCGAGHYTMQDKFIVLEDDQLSKEPYTKFFRQPPANVAMNAKP